MDGGFFGGRYKLNPCRCPKDCGPNAVQTLSAFQVEVFVGQSGTVREVIERYTSGDIKSTSTPNVADHYGMGGGAGIRRKW